MFKKEIQAATTVAVCGLVIVVAAAVVINAVKNRRKKRIIPRKVRRDIIEVLEAAGAEVNHTGKVGESVMRHKLENMSDKQLISIYAAMKVAKKAKGAGFDPVGATVDQIAHLSSRFDKATNEPETRENILEKLFSLDLGELRPLLSLALALII